MKVTTVGLAVGADVRDDVGAELVPITGTVAKGDGVGETPTETGP